MNKKLYQWVWRWHFIGGMLCLPIIIVLAITGIIYLFKGSYEAPMKEAVKTVAPLGKKLSYQQQWEIARNTWEKKPTAMILPTSASQATEFVSGKFSHKSSLFIDPYSGKVTGKIKLDETFMHKVRKVHGELFMGSFGTKIVELVASWMVVLLLTGLYVFWPRGGGIQAFFTIRTHLTRRVMYRDIHALSGFWFSAILLLMLAGGLPWTDIFGANFKWLQDKTHTGYPSTWDSRSMKSFVKGLPIHLDEMVLKAQNLHLPGEVSIGLPQSPTGVFSISNRIDSHPAGQVMAHYDQYSGKELVYHTWQEVGVLMQVRMWVMAFHQGDFGLWNSLLVLLTAVGLLVISASAVFSYLLRKKKGWGIPEAPNSLKLGYGLIAIIGILGIILPLFGASVLLILLAEKLLKLRTTRVAYSTSSGH